MENDFARMFLGHPYSPNISNWDVSNGMISVKCSVVLTNLIRIWGSWNVTNGNDFDNMFRSTDLNTSDQLVCYSICF